MTPQRFMAWQSEVLGTVLAANTTMALRSFRVMQALAAGKLPEQRESVRMVTEKAGAFSTGLFAAMVEIQRLWWRTAFNGWRVQSGFPTVGLDIVRASGQPARMAARRNARRLSRRTQ